MRRLRAYSAVFCLVCLVLPGCGKQAHDNTKGDPQEVKIDPKIQVAPPTQKKTGAEPLSKDSGGNPPNPLAVLDPATQEKYEKSLASALNALAERKWNEALTSFQTARDIQDSDFIRDEIAKLKNRISQTGNAKKTIQNIETVLNAGKPDEAAKLATQALLIYGDGDDAARLTQLRLQAEALQNLQKKEAPDERFQRYRKEGDMALGEKNLRAAALAFDQGLQARPDPDLQMTYDKIRTRLDKYDALRLNALEWRQDPAHLNQVIAALKEAAAVWDTLQIRQDLDDALLAVQQKRDNVSVANFEVRSDVGLPDAGAVIASQLLPLLKPKYDLVPRDELNQALQDLKLDKGFPDDPQQQQQVAKLANVRYVVVGRISRIAVVSVHARLIDLNTGLVMQTAKVLAPTIQDALERVPDLARQLLMTDQERMLAEQKEQKAPVLPQPIAGNAQIPPLPMLAANNAAPPPQIGNAPQPGFAQVQPAMLQFGPPPQAFVAPPPIELRLRNRLLLASVEMGDFLFRSRRFDEAQQKYQFALTLDPDNTEVQARADQTRPFASLNPLSSTRVNLPYDFKPRLLLLTFAASGDPSVVSPSLCFWTPANLAPYFWSRYEVVDPGEFTWFMARTGLTMQDLVRDPNALRWLSRAVGVRNFLFGSLVQSSNFDVNAYLVDAELAYLIGSARITVQDPYELKLRLPELAALTMMQPGDQQLYLAQQQLFDSLIAQGRRSLNRGDYDLAIPVFQQAVSLRPTSVQAQYYLYQAQRSAQAYALQNQRRRQYETVQVTFAPFPGLQLTLVQSSEQAREKAAVYAASRSDEDRQADRELRLQARAALIAQAQLALNGNQFGMSVNLFQGAQNVAPAAPAPLPVQDLERAHNGAQRYRQLRAAELTAAQNASLLQVRDLQLRQAQQQIAADQKRLQDAQEATRIAQQQRDDLAYNQGLTLGQLLVAKGNYDAAMAALRTAQQIKPTPVVNQLIDLTVQRQAMAVAKTDQERKILEAKYAAERDRRAAADLEVKTRNDRYQAALDAGQKALLAKNFDLAQARFEEAGKLSRTDAVADGLKQVEAGRTLLAKTPDKNGDDRKKVDSFNQFVAQGNLALKQKQYSAAAADFQQALKLMPNDPATAQLLQQAQSAANDQASNLANYQKALTAGQSALAAKQYASAIASFKSALAAAPNDQKAAQLLQQAQKAQSATEDAAQKLAKYQQAIKTANSAMSFKKFDDAAKAFADALKWVPNDPQAQRGLQDALRARDSARVKAPVAPAPEASKTFEQTMQKGAALEKELKYADAATAYQEALKFRPKDAEALAGWKKNQFNSNMSQGQQYLSRSQFVEASREFDAALRIFPNDPNALKLAQKAKNRMK